ncbi:MAG: hypothetical protein IKE66_10855 [Hyphomicrobium sp.]|jgi:hypothetical protein|nr:hypothetical protein [Hyphomicrobium sp.]
MCFSAEASFTAAAILLPAGGFAIRKAYQINRNLVPLATLPMLFGMQQLFEGLVWTGNALSSDAMVERYSLAYMFFSWLAWPIWVPFSTYFLEPCRRRHVYLLFAILGGMIGAMQYFPYFAHDSWLVTKFFPNAISYQGTVLFDFIMQREYTYAIYLFVIIVPLLTSSNRRAQVFGILISLVAATTYLFFQFAYISVFCFGGALMSLYIIYMIFSEPEPAQSAYAAC